MAPPERLPLVLVSGGTGFLGKAMVYLLLQHTELNVLVLVRRKRGRDVASRAKYYKSSLSFRSLQEHVWDRVTFVEGGFDERGVLQSTELQQYRAQVNAIIHSAANVRFDEPLPVAVASNSAPVSGDRPLLPFSNRVGRVALARCTL
eukprot:scaffold3307_cov371-Prasinococcus_capsulatus_cf.AAC.8